MVCPACRYMMDDFDKECPRCHGKGIASPHPNSAPDALATPVQSTQTHPQPPPDVAFLPDSSAANGLQIAGGLLMGLGLICAAYYFLFFDTSVAVPTTTFMGTEFGGGRVNNIGLMAQRQNGILIGVGMAIVGAVLFAIGQSQGASPAQSLPPHPPSSDRDISALFIFSALLPIGGIVLCLINTNRPERAKAAAFGTGIGFVLGLILLSVVNANSDTAVKNTFQAASDSSEPVSHKTPTVNAPEPSPISPPVAQAPQSYTVRYEVISQEGGMITYTNGQGNIGQITDAPDEWEESFTVSGSGFLSLSAQNKADYGNVWVTIYVNDEMVNDSECEGAYCVASTTYSLP